MKCKLSDFVSFKNGKKRPIEEGTIPVYGGNGVLGYTNLFNNQNCVIIGRVGAYCGAVYYEANKCWVSDNAIVGNEKENADIKFIYYSLKTLSLNQRHIGTSQPLLTQEILNKIEVDLPDLGTQKKIAKILSALDDKIECNNQINKNLEEQAQLLYKSCFIDFEPFGGKIPNDWEETDIYSLSDIIYGAPFASKYFNTIGEGLPIIRIRDLKDQKFTTYTTEKHLKGYLLQQGDIVVGMDGEFRPYIWGNTTAWLNQRVCVFKNKRPKGKAFLYYTLKPLLSKIEQTQVATTVIHIGKKEFDSFKITLPASHILDKFDEITAPMIDQIVLNKFESEKLSNIRDTLLSKLMSGELDVSDIGI